MNDYHGGTVPLSKWQVKLAQRVGGFDVGCHMLIVNVTGGTVEPTWCIMGAGKTENGR
jgi:hypothetical protein